ncbi:MAG TPA: phosphoenolpyruvate carboxylase [Patescibacteria group bacterium]|nr:phosphoenolpyruvate carboxylase [Patescibacteria group bacterium]
MTRKIPATMASQHPDHANVPYWHHTAHITVHDEYKELFINFSEIGIDEYKWDWEGKLVDESVMERLLGEYFTYFKDNPLGREKFLTFRLPNPKAETEFRLARAFFNLLSAAALTKKVGLHSPPLFEVILPMTESAEEIIAIQEAFTEIGELKHALYKFDEVKLDHIEVIPLFEQVDTIINSDTILETYLNLYKKTFKSQPLYLRPYMARSDPALNSGMVPTVIAIKIALSRYKKLSKKLNLPLYPIIGTAALPFRGGLTPDNVEQFVDEYAGIRTALIQSGFRYDYDLETVKTGIAKLNKLLPKSDAVVIPETDEKILLSLIPYFEEKYKKTVETIAPTINALASQLPKRRERVQHIGLFGYSRGMGKVTLPRAIGFTGALYSIGIPPELFGTGSGIDKTLELKQMHIIEKYYTYLKADIIRAGAYLNKDNLNKLIKQYPGIRSFKKKIEILETYVGQELRPRTLEEQEHQILTTKIWDGVEKGEKVTELIARAAILRKSLG